MTSKHTLKKKEHDYVTLFSFPSASSRERERVLPAWEFSKKEKGNAKGKRRQEKVIDHFLS